MATTGTTIVREWLAHDVMAHGHAHTPNTIRCAVCEAALAARIDRALGREAPPHAAR